MQDRQNWNYQIQLNLGSLDGSTYTGVPPKGFTLPCAVILLQSKASKNGTN